MMTDDSYKLYEPVFIFVRIPLDDDHQAEAPHFTKYWHLPIFIYYSIKSLIILQISRVRTLAERSEGK